MHIVDGRTHTWRHVAHGGIDLPRMNEPRERNRHTCTRAHTQSEKRVAITGGVVCLHAVCVCV